MARPRRSPWPLAWLAIANGWSNERLAAEYLRCWDRPLDGRLDVFTSFRSMDDGRGGYSLFARDFYNSWLRYWPARLGRLVVYAEDDAKTAAVVGRLVGCLGAACAAPAVAVATYDVSRATRAPHKVAGAAAAVNANFTALDDVQMQAWEYVLDLLSEAEYLAVLDDDSCLQDVVLPRGDLAACDGRLVVANYTRAGLGRSPADFCADVTAAWASCFRDVRTAAGVAWTGWNIYRPPEGG